MQTGLFQEQEFGEARLSFAPGREGMESWDVFPENHGMGCVINEKKKSQFFSKIYFIYKKFILAKFILYSQSKAVLGTHEGSLPTPHSNLGLQLLTAWSLVIINNF